ncbi:MAG: hypothetical protein AB7O26_13415 [Planctomycetaceae bacterium]
MTGTRGAPGNRAARTPLDAQQLEPHVPTATGMLAFILFASALLVYFAWQPLWHTDLWGHLAYGRWMSEHRSLPANEPFLPWQADEPFVDTAWLSQWIGYTAYRTLGIGGIQFLYAGGIAFSAGMLAYSLWRRCGSPFWGVFGAMVFLFVDWEQLRIVRPQLAGLVCYSILLSIILRPKERWELARVSLLFITWTNLHGSFVIGWVAILATLVGRAFPMGIQSQSLRTAAMDPEVRRSALLLGIATAVTLVNPYGWRLYFEISRVASHPNLHDLIEWKPLFDHPRQLTAYVAVGAITIAAIGLEFARRSNRRVSLVEWSVFLLFAAAASISSRMILWWGPIAGWILAIIGSSLGKPGGRDSSTDDGRRPLADWKPKAMGAAILLVAIASTPAGMEMVTGRPQRLQDAVSTQTPIGAAEFLRDHPATGRIFNPMEWGDYLVWSGPEDLEIFANSHAHLIPPEIWRDYMRAIEGGAEALAILDRHNVEVVVTDPDRQGALIESLRASSKWKQSYEDDRSIVFEER